MNNNRKYLGNAIKGLRNSMDVNQRQIAQELNLTTSAYSHYETGTRLPDLISLIKLSKYFNININYLVFLSILDVASIYSIPQEDIYRLFTLGRIIPEDHQELLNCYERLDKNQKSNVLCFMKASLY